jgi:hypothetical protein
MLTNVTKALEGANESLLRQRNTALEEQITDVAVTHQEAFRSLIGMQKQLELEKNTMQEELENLKKELEERERSIKFTKKKRNVRL